MAIGISPNCILCNRPIADGSIALYVTKGTIATRWPGTTSTIQRFGGKVKPRGVICVECANNKLPEPFHFEA